MLAIYYINLRSRPDRRDYMEEQFARLGLHGKRIEAVTPLDIPEEDKARYCNTSHRVFLRENELACTLSHERAWAAMMEDGHERALILEDDVELSTLLPGFLIDAGQVDADLIRIETTGNPMRVFPATQVLPCGVAIRPFRSTPMGSAGYLIRAAAARRIKGTEPLRRRHMDLALYSPFHQPGSLLSKVVSDPAMCRQLNMTKQASTEVARSDIASKSVPHVFAREHPVRYSAFKLWTNLGNGLRNAADHLAQQRKGLVRKVVPFE